MLFENLLTSTVEFERKCIDIPHIYCKDLQELTSRLKYFNELAANIVELESVFTFASKDDEIRYYKFEKPEFFKYGVYYNKIYKIEYKKPIGLKKKSTKYYDSCLKNLNLDYKNNETMFEYYRCDHSYNDTSTFVRNSFEKDIFAVVKAASMIEEFLHNVSDPRSLLDKIGDYPKFKWSGTLVQAVQLVNFMVKGKLINNGNVSIADLMEHFQVTYDVDLKDYYKK